MIDLPSNDILQHVVDVHCHPTDAPLILPESMDRLQITVCAMATRQSDQVLVHNLATAYPAKVIPCFGMLVLASPGRPLLIAVFPYPKFCELKGIIHGSPIPSKPTRRSPKKTITNAFSWIPRHQATWNIKKSSKKSFLISRSHGL